MIEAFLYISISILGLLGSILFHPLDLVWLASSGIVAILLRLAGPKWGRYAGATFMAGLLYFAGFAWLSPLRIGLLPHFHYQLVQYAIFILLLICALLSLLLAGRKGFTEEMTREFSWAWVLSLIFLTVAIIMNLILTAFPQPLPLLIAFLALLSFPGLRHLPSTNKGLLLPIMAFAILAISGGRILYGNYLKTTAWDALDSKGNQEEGLNLLKTTEWLLPYDYTFKLDLVAAYARLGSLDQAENALARAFLLNNKNIRYDAYRSGLSLLEGNYGIARLYQDIAINLDGAGKPDEWVIQVKHLAVSPAEMGIMMQAYQQHWREASAALDILPDDTGGFSSNKALLSARMLWEGNLLKEARTKLMELATRNGLEGITARLVLGVNIPGIRLLPWQQLERDGGLQVYQGWNLSYQGAKTTIDLKSGDFVWISALGWDTRGIWPLLEVWVDDYLYQQIYVEGHLFWPYILNPIPPGEHTIRLSFANDYEGEGDLDRNLTISGILIGSVPGQTP